jgi:uncharacterized repeat protein (TIGR01451 family)
MKHEQKSNVLLIRWLQKIPLLFIIILLCALFPRLLPSQASTDSSLSTNQSPAPAQGMQAVTPALAPESMPVSRLMQNNEQLAGSQGAVKLKLHVPTYIKASEIITYTYMYTNTGSTDATDVEIEVKWVNFSLTETTDTASHQYCESDCGVMAGSVQGPAVTLKEAVTESGIGRFQVGTLKPGESGQFRILLRSNKAVYPQSNKTIIRPSGSARLFMNRSKQPVSEDTNNSMVVGPVLSVTKTDATADGVYPLRKATFNLKVGNAIGEGDIVDGHIRGDAREATNIIVQDTFPIGSNFISANGNYTVDEQNRTVTWEIEGPMLPGESVDLTVVYEKLDVAEDCGKIENKTYHVTSDEMPIKDAESGRYTNPGQKTATIAVVNPLEIQSIAASPANVPFGDEIAITIVVQNFYDKPATNVQLAYDLPTDVSYVSAEPSPATPPAGGSTGGNITWNFSMAAGTIHEPFEQTFTIHVKSSFADDGSNGTATLTIPTDIPSACVTESKGGGVKIIPRITLRKYTDIQDKMVLRGDHFTYKIDIENAGSQAAEGLSLTDILPGEASKNACFGYVSGSATIDGKQIEPTEKSGSGCGSLVWDNLTIPGKSTVTLEYQLSVQGYDYQTYCNSAAATLADEQIKQPSDKVCIKINPNIEVVKQADKTNVGPGEEVQFTLSLTNHENEAYTVGLYDMPGSFTFVRQKSGYAEPEYIEENLAWPLVELAPGASIQVVFIATVPEGCYATRSFKNSALFQMVSLGDQILVEPIPEEAVQVKVTQPADCIPPTFTPSPTPTPDPNIPTPTPAPKIVEYSLRADRSDVSLKDRVFYTLSIENRNTQLAVTGVQVENMLPEGFVFVEMDEESSIQNRPTMEKTENNETRLFWNLDEIPPGEQVTIVYKALSSDVVGQYNSTMDVRGPAEWKMELDGKNEVTTMVKPLMTIAPSITGASTETCVENQSEFTYRLVLLNTNSHDYLSTTVVISLPLGLYYLDPVEGSIPPDTIHTTADGETALIWEDIQVPKKPDNQAFTQVILEVNMMVGQTWGTLQMIAEATSPDGLIPRKDDAVDAILSVCSPPGPALGKDANFKTIWPGQKMVTYKISLMNTTSTSITGVTVEDILPEGMEFERMVEGPDPVTGEVANSLLWEGLSVPGGTTNQEGTSLLIYQARVVRWIEGQSYSNQARIVLPEDVFVEDNSSADIGASRPANEKLQQLYLPIISRQ